METRVARKVRASKLTGLVINGGCSQNLRCSPLLQKPANLKASNVKLVTVAGCNSALFTVYFNESIWAAHRESETLW